jgi:pyrroline-5-carboxylate reductase
MNKTIAFIGAGNMAEALIRGLLETKAGHIIATDVRAERLEQLRCAYNIEISTDNAAAAAKADIIVLAVKPQQMTNALGGLKSVVGRVPSRGGIIETRAASGDAAYKKSSQLIVSIAAGVTTARIERELGGEPRVVRSMPNTPALVGAGATAVCKGRFATEADLDTAETILKAVGIVVRTDEQHLDAVTALSGSGPAYIFYMAEAMIAAGIEAGLPADVAKRLAVQTVFGAGKLLAESGESPEQLRKKVTSPGGTTEAALKVKMERGFAKIVADAMHAAARRSRELSGG